MGQPPLLTKAKKPKTARNYNMIEGKNIKIVFVGDSFVDQKGYIFNVMGIPLEERANAGVAIVTEVPSTKICGATCMLQVTDGASDYDRVRPLAYAQADLFVLMYSSESKSSFDAVTTKWNKEVNHHALGVPKVLLGIGPRSEEENKNADIVSVEDAKSLAAKLGGVTGAFFAKKDDEDEAKASIKEILGHFDGIMKAHLRSSTCKKK
eukprot:jgi/Bigna1/140459/aug1.56_g15167